MHNQVGPATAVAARGFADGQKALIDDPIETDEEYAAAPANAPNFINGWTHHEEEERQRACVIAGIA